MKSPLRPQIGDALPKDEPQRIVASSTEADQTLGDVFQTLLRHKWFILGCLIASIAVASAVAYTRTPIYEATGSLRIDPHRATSLGLADLAAQGSGSSDQLDTEIETIKSEVVAINALNLLSDQDFKKFTGMSRSPGGINADAIEFTPQQQRVIGALKGGLTVKEIASTQLVSVSFRSPDPKLAAEIANDVIAAYLKQSFDSRYGSVAQVRTWLSSEMDKLRDQAAQAQSRLAKFQEQNNILETSVNNGITAGSSNITLDTLKQLNTSLTSARGETILREAQMRAVLAASPDVVASLSPNADVSAILVARSTLATKYSELSSKFGANYPPLIELKQEIEENNVRFQAAIGEIRKRATSDYNAAKATEQLLQTQYDDQVQRAYAQNRQEAEYAVLNVETRSASTLYDTLQGKLQQAGVDAGLNAINTVPLDRARIPLIPIEPKKTLIIAAGFFIGLFLGVGASFLREVVTDTVQSAELLEKRFKLHVISLIPHFSPTAPAADPQGKGANKALLRLSSMLVSYLSPKSRVTESFRNLRNGVLLSQEKVKTVLVTSGLAAEGKSMTAVNYAVVMAQQGATVLLIDADLRRPMVHRYLGISNSTGLSNLILNETAEVSFHNPLENLPNLSIVTAGATTSLPSEMLGSQRMHSLLETWEKQFDYVVVDSAPLLVVSDSLPLAQWADALVLVVRFNKTPVAAIRRLKTILDQARISITGVVLNDLPENNASYGGYGGYGYGAGYYE